MKYIRYINLEEGRGASGNPPHTGPSTTISSWTTNWSTHCRAQEGLWNHACTSNMFTTGHGNHASRRKNGELGICQLAKHTRSNVPKKLVIARIGTLELAFIIVTDCTLGDMTHRRCGCVMPTPPMDTGSPCTETGTWWSTMCPPPHGGGRCECKRAYIRQWPVSAHWNACVLFFLVQACPESPILASHVMVAESFGGQYIECCTLILYYFMHFFTF